MAKQDNDGKTEDTEIVSVCIKVWPSTKKRMDNFKIFRRETYDDIINRLLDGGSKKK